MDSLASPFPEGWYFVTSRQALAKTKLIQKTWMGENILAWSDDSGRVCVAEAYCAHLGSDMGPASGGCIRDGRLVCPFHGYEYDAAGQCVATPFAPAPKAARLRVFETEEVAGLIFGWWGIDGRPPQWTLAANPPDQADWSKLRIWYNRFPSHPQELTENSVDLAHLQYVHGYNTVSRPGPISIDGAWLTGSFDFRTTRRIAGLPLELDVSVTTYIGGVGYSYVEIQEKSIGMDMRLWVLPTPVDSTDLDLWMASQVREMRSPKRPIIGLRFLPPKLRSPLMNRFMAAQQQHDVLQDIVIWRNKAHRTRPRLTRSDGEIMAYRKYCQQFYPTPAASTDSPTSPARLS